MSASMIGQRQKKLKLHWMIKNLIFGVCLIISDFPVESLKANKNYNFVQNICLAKKFLVTTITTEPDFYDQKVNVRVAN